jgi:hypothetical protein
MVRWLRLLRGPLTRRLPVWVGDVGAMLEAWRSSSSARATYARRPTSLPQTRPASPTGCRCQSAVAGVASPTRPRRSRSSGRSSPFTNPSVAWCRTGSQHLHPLALTCEDATARDAVRPHERLWHHSRVEAGLDRAITTLRVRPRSSPATARQPTVQVEVRAARSVVSRPLRSTRGAYRCALGLPKCGQPVAGCSTGALRTATAWISSSGNSWRTPIQPT